ncbi:MAG TPA: DUF1836 domain-containing protein [Lachnospiraceae bacterium]|nr:DUF1836 domain-containing protein [Lachnospiraceae bacterium]
MTINSEDLLNSILDSLARIEYIRTDDIPSIDLYMDQVTTFMDKKLRTTTRNPGDDKILTKTMINNYAKNELLPPPIKKKYNKEHMLLLIFIYYYKSILSISDIQTLLKPITERFYQSNSNYNLEDIYNQVFSMEEEQIEKLKKDVLEKYRCAENTFADAPVEEQEFLQKFSFICVLSFDVYTKKLIIEKLVDDLREKKPETKQQEQEQPEKKRDKKEA